MARLRTAGAATSVMPEDKEKKPNCDGDDVTNSYTLSVVE
jgi:hypothetical protein